MTVIECIGKRVLATTQSRPFVTAGSFQEYKVLEVSPSGNYVRLMDSFGRKVWHLASTVTVLEALIMPEPYPRAPIHGVNCAIHGGDRCNCDLARGPHA